MIPDQRSFSGLVLGLFFASLLILTIPGTICAFQSVKMGQGYFEEEHLLFQALEQEYQPDVLTRIASGRLSPTWHGMVTNLPTDWQRAFDFTFRTANVHEFLGLTAITGLFLATDRRTWRETRRLYRQSHFARQASNLIVPVGDAKFQLGIVGALAGYGFIAGDDRALRTASQTVEAVLATGITVQILKHVTGRESPIAATKQKGRWKFFPHPKKYHQDEPRYYAFPSGHISSTMAVLTVAMNNYPNEKWLKPVGYSIVGLLGVGLVAKGMHWYSDLPLGVAMGYLFGTVVSRPKAVEAATAQEDNELKFSVAPVVLVNGVALRFGMSF